MEPSEIARLQAWYTRQCNGDWEHTYGITVQSLDNPGWLLSIDLTGTKLHDAPFAPIAESVGADLHPQTTNWLSCHVEGAKWKGAGDESKLGRLIHEFVTWAEKHDS